MSTKNQLASQRQQHLDNIVILEGQASNYGHEVPLHIATNLQNEVAKVKEIEVELDELEKLLFAKETPHPHKHMPEDRLKRLESSLDRIVVDIGEIKTTLAVLETRVTHTETDDHQNIHPWIIPLGTASFLIVSIVLMLVILFPGIH